MVLIFNQDFKFFGEFWKIIFKKLGIELLYFIIYHFQINRFNKRTNQIVKITLCFFLYTITNNRDLFSILPKI